jgi:hypothetical protein
MLAAGPALAVLCLLFLRARPRQPAASA